MKFATLSILVFATTVAAKQFCFGGCIKCYCGDVLYQSHGCRRCSCDHRGYVSGNTSTPQGTCDLPGGFHQGCGFTDQTWTNSEC
ncbi:hypothetical protein LY76DRAFT_599632, partial [Colletotrichum caudatum]